MWNPNLGCDPTKLTATEFVGKHSPNPDKTFWKNDWNNFAPSLGFSYSIPWFRRSTVIRGGYGINYAGAPDFLGYSGNIGNLPGQTLNVTYSPPGYLDLTGLPAANVVRYRRAAPDLSALFRSPTGPQTLPAMPIIA